MKIKEMKDRIQLKPPGNWLNDPNGFIYYKGRYHLFFQHNPKAPVWDTMHWGHAVSDDLITWEHLDIALYPSCKDDQNGCFSGSAVENDGKMHLFYTGIRFEGQSDIQTRSCQIHIVSEDGVTFDNAAGKKKVIPSLTDPEVGSPADTRDPKVWKEGNYWYMILGSTMDLQYGMLTFFKSEDLEHWEHLSTIKGDPSMGYMWECPDLFRVDGRDVLIFSPMGLVNDGLENPNQAVVELVRFNASDGSLSFGRQYSLLDAGMDLYAPQSAIDEAGRRILTAWVRMPRPVDNSWCGMMCAPRVVEVRNDHVYCRMHPNIRNAFKVPVESRRAACGGKLLIRMHLKNGEGAEIFGQKLRREKDILYSDRSAVYVDKPDARVCTKTGLIREGTELEILVDPNLTEIYVNNGEYILTQAVYGLTEEITAPAGSGLTIWTLEETK